MPFIDGLYYTDIPAAGALFSRENAPVVLIHGAFGTYLDWPTGLRRIPSRRTLAVDLPGHGKSKLPPADTIQAHAESLTRWLTSLTLGQVILVGHSMGGAVALETARYAPTRIQRLVLLNSALRLPLTFIPEKDVSPSTSGFGLAQSFAKMSWSPVSNDALILKTTERFMQCGSETINADLKVCQSADLSEYRSEKPTLIIAAEQDAIIPMDFSRQMAARLRPSKLVIFEGAGHMVMFERTAEVMAAIGAFLDS